MTAKMMEKKVEELKELEALIAECQEEAEKLKDELKEAMNGQDTVQAGIFKITWKEITSSRLDTKALRATYPEIAETFSKTSTTRRFCIA